MYLGWNVGAVSVKLVRLSDDGRVQAKTVRHGGDPQKTVALLLNDPLARAEGLGGVVVSGAEAPSLFALPYLPESLCLESALRSEAVEADLALSLGGETFVAYCLNDGMVRGMVSSNRCAAGSGEFLVQQFARMGLDLGSGLAAAEGGRRVPMASRCSVHCKSDATHKLNKGECSAADIARSLIAELAAKIATLVESTSWPRQEIVLAGGLTLNPLLVADLHASLRDCRVQSLKHSAYLEALGAAAAAREAGTEGVPAQAAWLRGGVRRRLPSQDPLGASESRVSRADGRGFAPLLAGSKVILGVDAGSTTTKAVLMDVESRRSVAGCYLRTHGNPVRATAECLAELRDQVGETDRPVILSAVTGSGRDLVSVFLDNCLSFNEILAHARAARHEMPHVDTLFELGGQDAKFVALRDGVPVDYSMNDGCSAGTGSFLEEAATSDMQVPVTEIGELALRADRPVAFGERCAAFINTDIRAALQQGAARSDVLAGLIYAIVDNYLARVVGARQIGRAILLQGGVALNPALAPAVAARTAAEVIVPPQPELMGCLGAALMAQDLLVEGRIEPQERPLASFGSAELKVLGEFACETCDNRCTIRRIAIGEHDYPFGGLCSKWEMRRRPKSLRQREGRDLVELRREIMFKRHRPAQPDHPTSRVGLPLALSTLELYPLYATLLARLGCEVVLSRQGLGERRTNAPICYPGELAHAAVDDLLAQGVDYLFVPYWREYRIPEGHEHAYSCSVVEDVPDILRAFFAHAAERFLTPEIGLADHLADVSRAEVCRMGARLGVSAAESAQAWSAAVVQQDAFEREYQEAVSRELEGLEGPAVVLVGRPYAAFASEVNLSVPRKIASRGLTVIPGDAVAFTPSANRRNVWHFTQRMQAAVDFAKRRPDTYVCALSCFSCGPDAISHHRLRHELAGEPFCFLEIDSHTAHAGVETRVGAFLEIVDARRARSAGSPSREETKTARLETERRARVVTTADCRRLQLGDPGLRHVLLADLPWITSEMFASLYTSMGWRVATTPDMDHETVLRARSVCSGRECLPFVAMVGAMLQYLDTRPPGEATVFHLLEQEGPCQIGAWFDAVETIFGRLGIPDAVAAWPTIRNNYLGGGEKVALVLTAATSAGDLMSEARASLECLAEDREAALAICAEQERELLAAARHGLIAAERQLRRTARRFTQIPLRSRPEATPKVLLFGGINRIFVDKQVRTFFGEHGILAKTNEVSEFTSLLEFESVNRAGFAASHIDPMDQWQWRSVLAGLRNPAGGAAARRAVRGRMHLTVVDQLSKRWRAIMASSGLLFSVHSPFRDVLSAGQEWISWNGFTEAPCSVGRYLSSLRRDSFDGYVNLGAFNCSPANTATAVINAMRAKTDVPYAVIEADGTALTPGQVLQLETVAAQVWRRHAG